MATQHDKQFKLDAIRYYQDHKDLGVRGCAENLGIGYSTLTKWLKDFRESGDILSRVITHPMSRRKSLVLDVNYVMPKMLLMYKKKQSTFWENDGSHLSQSI